MFLFAFDSIVPQFVFVSSSELSGVVYMACSSWVLVIRVRYIVLLIALS